MDRSIELDELVEHWTLVDDEHDLVAGKRGATRLGFALLLKFYLRHGRFPRGRGELPDPVVRFVADQVKVSAAELGLYEWSGRTVEFHRSQIRTHLGFRECSVEDAEKLAAWLAAELCEAVPWWIAPSIIAATSDAEQARSWEWIAMDLRSTCQ